MKKYLHNRKTKYILATLFAFVLVCMPLAITYAQATPPMNDLDATWGDASSWYDIPGKIIRFIEQGLVSVSSFILWLVGMVFDWVMEHYVAGFGKTIKDDYGQVLKDIWTIVRDLCNLAFIFGFIYIGIMTIIDPDKTSPKKLLGNLIICAILINFSLYLSQVVIDISNFVATQVYNAIAPGGQSISLAISNYLHLEGFWSAPNPDLIKRFAGKTGTELAFFLSAFIFMLVVALILAFTALLLFVRFVELVLIMMFSPIIFGARVFPGTQKYSETMIHKLIYQSLFAPAYMLLLYVSLTIIGTIAEKDPSTPFNELFLGGVKQDKGALEIVIVFVIGIILLWKSLSLAQYFGVHGSKITMGLATKARQGAQSLVGRNLVGRPADVLGKKFRNLDARMATSNSRLARWGNALVPTHAIQNTLDMGKNAKFGGQSREDIKKQDKAQAAQRFKLQKEQDLMRDVQKGLGAASGSPEEEAFEKAIVKASTAQLISILGSLKPEEFDKVVARMGHSQFEKLMDEKEEEFSNEKKEKLKKARQKAIMARETKDEQGVEHAMGSLDAQGNYVVNPQAPEQFAKLLIGDLEVLGADVIKNNARYLTAAQLDELKKSKKFVESQYKNIDDARTEALKKLEGDDVVAEMARRAKKADDAAKLPPDFLVKAAGIKNALSVNVLEKIIKQGTMDRSKQQQIIDTLRTQTDLSPEMEKFVGSSYVIDRFGTSRNTKQKTGGTEETNRSGREL
jgi:hypothetical protein